MMKVMPGGNMKKSFSVLLGLALTVLLFNPLLGAETQIIDAEVATQDGNWGKSSCSGIKIMQTGMPGAKMTFEVTVSAPGGTYQVFLPVVKAFDSAHIGIYFDGELQVEADTFAASNVEDSILVTERSVTQGEHTIRIKNLGQQKAHGGNYYGGQYSFYISHSAA